jgi:16S rRNA G966 N2-methylase RsmD
VFDCDGNRLDRTSTATETPLRGLHIVGDNRAQAHDYRPTPRRLVAWALDCVEASLPGSLENTTFVDIGSGRGRVLFEAARRPFQRVVGIESAEELHEDAALNLRHWPRAPMRGRDIDLIHADALETPLPEGDLVVWMFDPFGERLMTRMAARLAEHSRRWQVTLVLVDPRNPMAFRESPTFKEIEPPKEIRRRIALLSPYSVRIFTAGPR